MEILIKTIRGIRVEVIVVLLLVEELLCYESARSLWRSQGWKSTGKAKNYKQRLHGEDNAISSASP